MSITAILSSKFISSFFAKDTVSFAARVKSTEDRLTSVKAGLDIGDKIYRLMNRSMETACEYTRQAQDMSYWK